MLTIGQVDVVASWGGEEDGTGWELAVRPSQYMRARVTVKALCQIMGLSKGALSVSLPIHGEHSGWSGRTAVPGCSAPDTQASTKTACNGFLYFCVCVNICLACLGCPCALLSDKEYLRICKQIFVHERGVDEG